MATITLSEGTVARLKAVAVGYGMDPEELLLEFLDRIEEEEAASELANVASGSEPSSTLAESGAKESSSSTSAKK